MIDLERGYHPRIDVNFFQTTFRKVSDLRDLRCAVGVHMLPCKVFDPKELQVKSSRIRSYSPQTATVVLVLLVSRDVGSRVSRPEAEGMRIHDVIVRLLRVWSKGCSSQWSELLLWKTATLRISHLFCGTFSTAASQFPPPRSRDRACARRFPPPGR